ILVKTGQLPFHDDLKAKTPLGLLEMLRLPGMGPKKVRALHQQLGIDDLDKLRQPCLQGSVAGLKGFGAKTQEKILDGLDFLSKMGQRARLDEALELATGLLEGLRNGRGFQRIELCGSLRRRKETIQDIDILVSADDPGPIMDRFVALPGVIQVVVW